MRELISLQCGECKTRNYYITKNKRKHPEKSEIKKHCRVCRKHVVHKEGKV